MSLSRVEACKRVSVCQESLDACREVSVSLGSLDTCKRASVSLESLDACREVSVSLGSLEACKRASLSLVSLFEVSHYACFARALVVTTFCRKSVGNL